ncbi:50S ribosomal protein L13 [Candidatus Daviesbacteria bacterium]|nr:50S ribosomal protein L13 [Candidatus Daviesbacteria bacterium]
MSTNKLAAGDIKREWHLIDAKNQILGRLSTQAAALLMGKNKSSRVPYLDCGDFVVVINASKVKVSGKKEQQKEYVRHSGYPGGLKVKSFINMKLDKPEEVIRHAVKGMLPKNKLSQQIVKKLYIFASDKHPFVDKFKEEQGGN